MLEKMDSLLDRASVMPAPPAKSASSKTDHRAEPRPLTADDGNRILRDAERCQQEWGTSFDYEDQEGPAPPLDVNHHPQWSFPAMIAGSVLTSLPFALLHVDQQGHSLGPFLLLILVSLILCTVRLKTRSLAASTLVHATYNFIIFALALIGTGGFRHFDKM